MNDAKKNIAVILAGCGHLDGAEIREAVLTLLALDQQGANAQIYAPDREQHHVVNHITGQEVTGSKRNILEEAARIARGDIKKLSELNPHQVHGIILPGGFGAAKNLCNFAFKGAEGTVIPELRELLIHAHSHHIPIGGICISPAILAMAFKGTGTQLHITLGQNGESAQEAEKMGAHHHPTAVTEITIDEANRVATTAAYMYGKAGPADIFQGISKLVEQILAW